MKEELKEYIQKNIFPKYKNFYSHDINHINRVIETSLMLAKFYNLNLDMAYVIGAYHDLGLKVDRNNHEKESGIILDNDTFLRKFFSEEEIKIMKEAVEDHRGSRKERPRSLYGEIVSDADRDFDFYTNIRRAFSTAIKNSVGIKDFEYYFDKSYSYLLKRLNKEGHFNLWTNNPTLIEQRNNFEKQFLDKDYTKTIYKKEYDRITSDGTFEKIINFYEDF